MPEAMELMDWDRRIKPHLHMISAGADVVERHIGAIIGQPDFQTIAEQDLDVLLLTLTAVLRRLEKAKQEFRNKAVIR